MALRLFGLIALLLILPAILASYLESIDRLTREQLLTALHSRSTMIAHAFIEQTSAGAPRAIRGAQLVGFGAESGGAGSRPAVASPVPVATPPGTSTTLPAPGSRLEPAEADAARATDPAAGEPLPFSANYWDTTEFRLAALAYFALMAMAVLMAVGFLRGLSRFRAAAYEIALGRIGDNALAARNGVRELSGIAHLLDRLVFDLRYLANQMRLTASENAHSLRTPLATMHMAMGAIRRTLPADEPRTQRALKIIDMSLDRLSQVVNAAQRNDMTMANLVAAPRTSIDFSALAQEVIGELDQPARSRNILVRRKLRDAVIVHANSAALKAALLDVATSAIDASSRYGEVAVVLEHHDGQARLTIEDRGGGAESPELFFQHDFESAETTPQARPDATAARLGLWNVKRTIEAFGGQVSARRNQHGGASVGIALPCDRQ
ncbi:MAG TPA: HAMP domain-containing sensor histidine kinase [Reyranella sp.]|nr:HAMP domain-containing sensor histidine kinase [Reyranella sp.]